MEPKLKEIKNPAETYATEGRELYRYLISQYNQFIKEKNYSRYGMFLGSLFFFLNFCAYENISKNMAFTMLQNCWNYHVGNFEHDENDENVIFDITKDMD